MVTLPRFDLEAALRLAQEHRMRRLFVVPPIVLALARHPMVDAFDLSALEVVLSGAAPLGPELEAACASRLGCEVVQGYGMTEMSPVSHFTPAGRRRPGSVGMTAPNTECRIVDPESGADRPAGETGELWVKGPQVMLGYLNNPEATAATLQDGWLRTGDLGRLDADGYLFVVDRVKELIKVKGFQVPPAELEALLLTHPDVADAAVIGLPDEECRRGADGLRGARRRRRPEPRAPAGLRRRPRRELQAAAPGRLRRRDPEVALGQDPPPHPARSGPRGSSLKRINQGCKKVDIKRIYQGNLSMLGRLRSARTHPQTARRAISAAPIVPSSR